MERAQIGDKVITLYGTPDLETSVRPTSFHIEDEKGVARFVIVSSQLLPYGTVKYIAYENELNPDRRVEVIDQVNETHLPANHRWAVKVIDKTGQQSQYAGNLP